MEKSEFQHDESRDLFIGMFDGFDVYYRGFHSNKKDRHLNGFTYRNFASRYSDIERDDYDTEGHLSRPSDRFTKYSDVSTKNVKTYYSGAKSPNFLSTAKKAAINKGVIIKSFGEKETLDEKNNMLTLQFELLEEDKKLYKKIKLNPLGAIKLFEF